MEAEDDSDQDGWRCDEGIGWVGEEFVSELLFALCCMDESGVEKLSFGIVGGQERGKTFSKYEISKVNACFCMGKEIAETNS